MTAELWETKAGGPAGVATPPYAVRTARPDEYDRVAEVTYLGFGHGEPGAILGTASLLRADSALVRQSRDGEVELRLLAVLPEARRRGIGEALMREALGRAHAWGAPALVLDTGPQNERSQRLYHRLGFERLPERETIPASRGGYLAVFRFPFG